MDGKENDPKGLAADFAAVSLFAACEELAEEAPEGFVVADFTAVGEDV